MLDIEALRRKAHGHNTPLVTHGANGRRRTCRYVKPGRDERCTATPVGSLDAEIELCINHLRLALELIAAEDITI